MVNSIFSFLNRSTHKKHASLTSWIDWCRTHSFSIRYHAVWSLSCPTQMIEKIAFDQKDTVDITHHWPGFGSFWGPCPADWIETMYHFPFPQRTAIQTFFNLLQEPLLHISHMIECRWNPALSRSQEQAQPWEPWIKGCIGTLGENLPSRWLIPHLRHLQSADIDAWSLQTFLTHLLGVRISLQTFQGIWQNIPKEIQTALGVTSTPLGKGVTLGSRVWMQQGGLKICLHLASLKMYQKLSQKEGVPRGLLMEALKAWAPLGTMIQIQWEVSLTPAEKPSVFLGEPTWLGHDKENRWIKQEAWITP